MGLSTNPTSSKGTSTAIGLDSIVAVISKKWGANSVPATVAACIMGSGIVDAVLGTIGVTATSQNIKSCIIASDSTSIFANQASNILVSTCSSVRNEIFTALSKPPYSNYVPPTSLQAHDYGRMHEYFNFFSGLNEISITGKTLQFPGVLNLSSLNSLSSFTLNGSIVENTIVLPTNMSTLNISNSTLCLGGAMLSNVIGANLKNPGFIKTTVNTAAILFNAQDGTGPLCAGNIGSIPSLGSFSVIDDYANLYSNILNELKAAKSLISDLKSISSSTILENQNLNNSLLNAISNLNSMKATLNSCINSFASQVTSLAGNLYAVDLTIANNCTFIPL